MEVSLNTESVQRGMRGRGHRREGIISLSVSQGGRDNASGVCTGALKGGVRGGGETSRGVGAGPGGGRGRGEPQGRSRPTPKGGRRRQERRPRCRRLEAFVRGGREEDRIAERRRRSSASGTGACSPAPHTKREAQKASASTGTVSFAILSASTQASSSASYGLGPTGSRERTECRPKASDAPRFGGGIASLKLKVTGESWCASSGSSSRSGGICTAIAHGWCSAKTYSPRGDSAAGPCCGVL
mmetsp:Transcript_23041/g.67956  ORF Transcript_23041/g.67956 Transcript_23041/m.67956 type:complete len:243 (+) Transcript_23041:55-783(+)